METKCLTGIFFVTPQNAPFYNTEKKKKRTRIDIPIHLDLSVCVDLELEECSAVALGAQVLTAR